MSSENNIKEWLMPKLLERGLSIERFSNKVGVTRAALYFYMNDTSRPEVGTMAAICRELNVPLEEGLRQYIPKPVGRPSGRRRRVN